jgi:NAD(P)-dependent dehydrogenase (short-subunit alcohol dehydrogenase family)
VETLTRVLAVELQGSGIRVNAMRPGIVDTEMQVEIRAAPEERFGSENVSRFRGYKERGLLRPPEHPARLILWMLSDEAADLNGEVLALDDPEVAAKVGLEPGGR